MGDGWKQIRSDQNTYLYYNGRQDEARPNLDELHLRVLAAWMLFPLARRLVGLVSVIFLVLGRLLLLDLVCPHPDLAVDEAEAHDVVDKGLGLARTGRHAKVLHKHLPEEAEVRLCVKGAIKRQDRPRSFKAVAGEMQFALRRDGVNVELGFPAAMLEHSLIGRAMGGPPKGRMHTYLHRGTVWGARQIHVEILALSGLEEEHVVAVLEPKRVSQPAS